MPGKLASKVDVVANVAIIVAACLFSAVLIKSYLIAASDKKVEVQAPVTQKLLKKGDTVDIPNLGWPRQQRTLLLALSTTCHFRTDSASFYQRISKDRGNTHLVALVPQEKTEGEEYLAKLGVKVDEIRQVSFSNLGVTGTPTLALIDSEGKVVNTWEGALSADKENEVLGQLKQETSGVQ